MSKRATRRILGATSRVEAQRYQFMPEPRLPRLAGNLTQVCYCVIGSTVPAATGTFPNINPGVVPGISVYSSNNGTNPLVDVGGVWKIYNWWPTTFAASKILAVIKSADGYQIINQAC